MEADALWASFSFYFIFSVIHVLGHLQSILSPLLCFVSLCVPMRAATHRIHIPLYICAFSPALQMYLMSSSSHVCACSHWPSQNAPSYPLVLSISPSIFVYHTYYWIPGSLKLPRSPWSPSRAGRHCVALHSLLSRSSLSFPVPLAVACRFPPPPNGSPCGGRSRNQQVPWLCFCYIREFWRCWWSHWQPE